MNSKHPADFLQAIDTMCDNQDLFKNWNAFLRVDMFGFRDDLADNVPNLIYLYSGSIQFLVDTQVVIPSHAIVIYIIDKYLWM